MVCTKSRLKHMAVRVFRVLRPTAVSLRYLRPTATRRLASSIESKSTSAVGKQEDAVKETTVTNGRRAVISTPISSHFVISVLFITSFLFGLGR